MWLVSNFSLAVGLHKFDSTIIVLLYLVIHIEIYTYMHTSVARTYTEIERREKKNERDSHMCDNGIQQQV